MTKHNMYDVHLSNDRQYLVIHAIQQVDIDYLHLSSKILIVVSSSSSSLLRV